MDEVVMVKLLVLQQWYGLSDPELEKQALNRLDFQHFLGWPEQPPDYSTVWQFRERLASTGRHEEPTQAMRGGDARKRPREPRDGIFFFSPHNKPPVITRCEKT